MVKKREEVSKGIVERGGRERRTNPSTNESVGSSDDVLVEEDGSPDQAGNEGGSEDTDEESNDWKGGEMAETVQLEGPKTTFVPSKSEAKTHRAGRGSW